MSVIGKRYTLIHVCEELSGDKVTIIVFHGYREVVSPRAEAVAMDYLVTTSAKGVLKYLQL